jgi:4-diphosphocytidyl-2-C-methyl-D-erythritol kinase
VITVFAPAKLNLVLEILGKDKNMHTISSVLQTINLFDTITLKIADSTSFKCNIPELQKNNIVMKALYAIEREIDNKLNIKIELFKCIPWSSGLGGGSSDAAYTLLALNKLYSLGLSEMKLSELASHLGSDCSFFIYGGTAFIEGTGQLVTPLKAIPTTWFVLLMPPLLKVPDKTAQLYKRIKIQNYSTGDFTNKVIFSIVNNQAIHTQNMFNAFEDVAFDYFPNLDEYRRIFQKSGAHNIHLAGSGPCLFAAVAIESEAYEICSRLKARGLESYAVSSLPANSGDFF